MSDEYKYPIILLKKSKVTDIKAQWCHYNTAHIGRRGFLLVCGSSVVQSSVSKCIACHKLRRITVEQMMADLAKDRSEKSPPFTYCTVDMFGPFTVLVKRTTMTFNYLPSRAFHIEVTNSILTDSFIQALKRLISWRTNMSQICLGKGSNC